MRGSTYAWVWACTAGIVVCAFAAIVLVTPRLLPVLDFSGDEIVVIGSSRLRHAIPMNPVPGGLLGDGRPHRMATVGGLSEPDLLVILEQAVLDRVPTVLIEANDLVWQHRQAERVRSIWRMPSDLAKSLRSQLSALRAAAAAFLPFPLPDLRRQEEAARQRAFRGSTLYRTRTGQIRFTVGVSSWFLDITMTPESRRGARHIHWAEPPRERLRTLLQTARSSGQRVILLLPPESRLEAEATVGPSYQERVRRAVSVAADLGVPLMAPAAPWPNELFGDPTHVNGAGRQRFLRELDDWRRAAP